jgi:hypothetical protein
MSKKEDSKVIWLTCPDCGSKIGIILSVGKPATISHGVVTSADEEQETWPPIEKDGYEEKLKAAGIDTGLINIKEETDFIRINPKKFLGDLWGPINDAIKGLNGTWIKEGRDSRWEIKKEEN